MIRLIIFDMDGLMFDTEAATMRAYLELGKSFGLPVTKEQFIKTLGKNYNDILRQYQMDFGEDCDPDGLYKAVGEVRNQSFTKYGPPVKDGLRALLAVLEEEGIPLAVASGSDDDVIRNNLELTGVAKYFSYVLSSRNVEKGKPAPDVFLAICDHFGVLPEETLVFEDSPNGIKAAIAGGIPVIAVPDLIPVPEDLSFRCLAVIPSLTEAVGLVQNLINDNSNEE